MRFSLKACRIEILKTLQFETKKKKNTIYCSICFSFLLIGNEDELLIFISRMF